MQKQVFLSYGYSAKNAGDLAICLGAIDLLIKKGYKVVVLSKYNRRDSEFLESKNYYESRYGANVKVLEAPFTLNRNANLFLKAFYNLQGLIVFLGMSTKLDK